jgi:hypothetical protein
MNSPTPFAFRQAFAQDRFGTLIAFAMQPSRGNCFRAGHGRQRPGRHSPRCYPSPSLRSGPSQAGPLPLPTEAPSLAEHGRKCFETLDSAVESGTITTSVRGRSPCGSRLSSSCFLPLSFRAACRILRPAGSPVQQRARLSPTRWTATWQPGPPLAVWPVSPPAGSNWACSPAPLADRLTVHGRTVWNQWTIRAARPDGLSHIGA